MTTMPDDHYANGMMPEDAEPKPGLSLPPQEPKFESVIGFSADVTDEDLLEDPDAYKEFMALRRRNMAKEKMLADSYGVGLEARDVTIQRITHLFTILFDEFIPENSDKRVAFEMKFQQEVGRNLDMIHEQVLDFLKRRREAAILQGVPANVPNMEGLLRK